MAMSPRMGATEWALLILLSVLWGGSFFFAKIAVAALPPLTLVLARVGLAALLLNLLLSVRGGGLPCNPQLWRQFFVMGLLNNLIPFSLIFWSQTQIASGLASILNATTPIFTVVLAHFLTSDERLTIPRMGGVMAGAFGVAAMIGPAALGGLGADLVAQIAVLGAAISYACAGIYGRRFRGVSSLVTATGQLTATTIMMAPLAFAVEPIRTLPAPGLPIWAAVVSLALFSTALGYVVYFRILATAGATNLLLVTFLIPVSALVLAIFVLGERPEPRHLLGMALIGLGLAAIDGRLAARCGALRRGDQMP